MSSRLRSLGAALRSLFIWSVGLTYFCFASLFMLAVALVTRGPFLDRCLKLYCRGVLVAAGVRFSVAGREHVQAGKQYIVVMNHVNIFDGFLLYCCFPGHLRGVEEESHFSWPVYGWLDRRIGNIPISRRSGPRAHRALREAAALIRARRDFSFAVLPEGTRTRNGRLGPFKRGAFRLALEAGLDVLPVVQRGGFAIQHRGSRLIRPGRVEVTIESPLPVAGHTVATLDRLVEETRSIFLHRLGESGPGAAPAAE